MTSYDAFLSYASCFGDPDVWFFARRMGCNCHSEREKVNDSMAPFGRFIRAFGICVSLREQSLPAGGRGHCNFDGRIWRALLRSCTHQHKTMCRVPIWSAPASFVGTIIILPPALLPNRVLATWRFTSSCAMYFWYVFYQAVLPICRMSSRAMIFCTLIQA